MGSGPKMLGRLGEAAAAEFFSDSGCVVVARNWRCSAGEIDLVVRDSRGGRRVLVFCEVKTRSSARWGDPSQAVDRNKQRRIRRLAAEFLTHGPGGGGADTIRFDVVEVLMTDRGTLRVNHIEDAFS